MYHVNDAQVHINPYPAGTKSDQHLPMASLTRLRIKIHLNIFKTDNRQFQK